MSEKKVLSLRIRLANQRADRAHVKARALRREADEMMADMTLSRALRRLAS